METPETQPEAEEVPEVVEDSSPHATIEAPTAHAGGGSA